MIRAVVAGMLVAAGLAAQSPIMAPWWEGPIVRDLNLNEDQQKKIRSTVSGSRSKIILLRANLEAAEADLAELMADDPVDLLRSKAAIEKVLTARTELGRQVSGMSLTLRQILTAQQWRELERRQQQQQQPRPGPNGPPNGPNPPRTNLMPNHPDMMQFLRQELPPGTHWQVVVLPRPDAEVTASNLKNKGFPVELRPVPNGRDMVRVLVGPYPDSAAADKARADLEKAGFNNPMRIGQ